MDRLNNIININLYIHSNPSEYKKENEIVIERYKLDKKDKDMLK